MDRREIEIFEARIRRSQRWLRVTVLGWVVSVLILVVGWAISIVLLTTGLKLFAALAWVP